MNKVAPNRKGPEIICWLQNAKHQQKDIHAAIDINPGLISRTINGHANNEKVLRWLYDRGCPVKYLAVPARFLAAWGTAA